MFGKKKEFISLRTMEKLFDQKITPTVTQPKQSLSEYVEQPVQMPISEPAVIQEMNIETHQEEKITQTPPGGFPYKRRASKIVWLGDMSR